jgi:hypothetical protein
MYIAYNTFTTTNIPSQQIVNKRQVASGVYIHSEKYAPPSPQGYLADEIWGKRGKMYKTKILKRQ